MRKLLTVVLSLLAFTAFPAAASAQVAADSPRATVMDQAQLLTPAEELTLASRLQALMDSYNLDIVAETRTNLNGLPLDDFARARASELGVGDSVTDNGLYLILVKDDRSFFIQPGVSISERVSSEDLETIVAAVAAPAFKTQAYGQGLGDSAEAVTDRYVAAPAPPPEESSPPPPKSQPLTLGVIGGAMVLVVGLLVAVQAPQRKAGQKQENALRAVRGDQEFWTLPTRRGRLAHLKPYLHWVPSQKKADIVIAVENRLLVERRKALFNSSGMPREYWLSVPSALADASLAEVFEPLAQEKENLAAQWQQEQALALQFWEDLSWRKKARVRNVHARKEKLDLLKSFGAPPINPTLLYLFIATTYPAQINSNPTDLSSPASHGSPHSLYHAGAASSPNDASHYGGASAFGGSAFATDDSWTD